MPARENLEEQLVGRVYDLDLAGEAGRQMAEMAASVTADDVLALPYAVLAALVEEHGRDKVLGWLGGERFGSYVPVDGVPVEECWAFPGKEGTSHE